jgi:hypothetical protein
LSAVTPLAHAEVRFTVRRLMIAVAVVAVLLAAGHEAARLARISAARRQYAASCAASEALSRTRALGFAQAAQTTQKELESMRSQYSLNPGRPSPAIRAAMDRSFDRLSQTWVDLALRFGSTAASYGRNAAYWGAMRRKYERGARTPWRSVEPDPPPAL